MLNNVKSSVLDVSRKTASPRRRPHCGQGDTRQHQIGQFDSTGKLTVNGRPPAPREKHLGILTNRPTSLCD
jgi:hypothetical protein